MLLRDLTTCQDFGLERNVAPCHEVLATVVSIVAKARPSHVGSLPTFNVDLEIRTLSHRSHGSAPSIDADIQAVPL